MAANAGLSFKEGAVNSANNLGLERIAVFGNQGLYEEVIDANANNAYAEAPSAVEPEYGIRNLSLSQLKALMSNMAALDYHVVD